MKTVALIAVALSLLALPALAQDECDPGDPDTLQISWTAPCEDGAWLLDTVLGRRMWDWHPAPEDTVTWSGSCHRGSKEGKGILQWFEHGRKIDRFEGTYRNNQRVGPGSYRWTDRDSFEGTYSAGLPQGPGTIYISGLPYSGAWKRGCLETEGKVIAINTPITSCGPSQSQVVAAAPATR